MQLLYTPTSPFARKVRVVAHETGMTNDIELILRSPWEEGNPVRETNPVGKVPTLLIEGGEMLIDSKVIVRYLLDKASNAQVVLPASSMFQQLTMEAAADGMNEASASRFLELNMRPPEKQMDMWLDRYRTTLLATLGWFSENIDTVKSGFTLGSISAAVALEYIDLRYPELNWREQFSALSAWHHDVAGRDSMISTAPPKG